MIGTTEVGSKSGFDWTAASVWVALFVFFVSSWFKRRERIAAGRAVAQMLLFDLEHVRRAASEILNHVLKQPYTQATLVSGSWADPYLSERMTELTIPAMNRAAGELAALPAELTSIAANCLAISRDLRRALVPLTSDSLDPYNRPSPHDAAKGVRACATRLLHETDHALSWARDACNDEAGLLQAIWNKLEYWLWKYWPF